MSDCCNTPGNQHTQTEMDGGNYMVVVVSCNVCYPEISRTRV